MKSPRSRTMATWPASRVTCCCAPVHRQSQVTAGGCALPPTSMLVKENSEMTAGSLTHGFPEDYFVIKSVSNDLLWDVSTSSVADGTEVILYKEKESSLVASEHEDVNCLG